MKNLKKPSVLDYKIDNYTLYYEWSQYRYCFYCIAIKNIIKFNDINLLKKDLKINLQITLILNLKLCESVIFLKIKEKKTMYVNNFYDKIKNFFEKNKNIGETVFLAGPSLERKFLFFTPHTLEYFPNNAEYFIDHGQINIKFPSYDIIRISSWNIYFYNFKLESLSKIQNIINTLNIDAFFQIKINNEEDIRINCLIIYSKKESFNIIQDYIKNNFPFTFKNYSLNVSDIPKLFLKESFSKYKINTRELFDLMQNIGFSENLNEKIEIQSNENFINCNILKFLRHFPNSIRIGNKIQFPDQKIILFFLSELNYREIKEFIDKYYQNQNLMLLLCPTKNSYEYLINNTKISKLNKIQIRTLENYNEINDIITSILKDKIKKE